MRVVLTAGGTHEPIDDVRYLANVATGSLPAALAETFLSRGDEVHYVHGPGAAVPGERRLSVSLLGTVSTDLDGAARGWLDEAIASRDRLAAGRLYLHPIRTAADAARALGAVVGAVQPDLAACAMAVADFAPRPYPGKISSRPGGASDDAGLDLHLDATAKAIDVVLEASPATHLLGFKLVSGASADERTAAVRALARRSGARRVFANDVRDYRRGHRRGWLCGPDGEVLAELDGGDGPDALGRLVAALADVLVTWVEGT